MRHLDLQILFSASYREKAENKTTLRIADLEPDTQDRREVRKILTVQLNHQSKAAGRNAAVEVMEKGHFTDKRSVHGVSHVVIFTHFPSSFSSNILIIGDIFQAVSLESRHVR